MHPSGWTLGMSCRPRHPGFDPLLGVPWITWYMFLTDGGLLLGMGPNSKGPYLVSFHVILKKKKTALVLYILMLSSNHTKISILVTSNVYSTSLRIFIKLIKAFWMYTDASTNHISNNILAKNPKMPQLLFCSISFKQLSQSYNIMKLALLGLHYVATTSQQRRDDMDRYCFRILYLLNKYILFLSIAYEW